MDYVRPQVNHAADQAIHQRLPPMNSKQVDPYESDYSSIVPISSNESTVSGVTDPTYSPSEVDHPIRRPSNMMGTSIARVVTSEGPFHEKQNVVASSLKIEKPNEAKELTTGSNDGENGKDGKLGSNLSSSALAQAAARRSKHNKARRGCKDNTLSDQSTIQTPSVQDSDMPTGSRRSSAISRSRRSRSKQRTPVSTQNVSVAVPSPSGGLQQATSLRSISASKRNRRREMRRESKEKKQVEDTSSTNKMDASTTEEFGGQKQASELRQPTSLSYNLKRKPAIGDQKDGKETVVGNGSIMPKYEVTLSNTEDSPSTVDRSTYTAHHISTESLPPVASLAGSTETEDLSDSTIHMISTESLTTVDSTAASLPTNGSPESLAGPFCQRLRPVPRLGGITCPTVHVEPIQSSFPIYREDSSDALERATFRLLSSSVTPFQTLIRQRLALRQAATRMWALTVIQACVRGSLVRSSVQEQHRVAVILQARLRGGWVREDQAIQVRSATAIQRRVRGLLVRLDVTEQHYQALKIQSVFRTFLAMNEAMDRLDATILMQSAARGFLARHWHQRQTQVATAIQTAYRCFSARVSYHFDLMDIILVQSLWRRKRAIFMVEGMQVDLITRRVMASLHHAVKKSLRRTEVVSEFLQVALVAQTSRKMRLGGPVEKATTLHSRNEQDLVNLIGEEKLAEHRASSCECHELYYDDEQKSLLPGISESSSG